MLSERLDVQSDCFLDVRGDFLDGSSRQDAAGQIGDV